MWSILIKEGWIEVNRQRINKSKPKQKIFGSESHFQAPPMFIKSGNPLFPVFFQVKLLCNKKKWTYVSEVMLNKGFAY